MAQEISNKIWQRIGPISDPPPELRIRWEIYEMLEEKQKQEVLIREMESQIRMKEFQLNQVQEELETMKMMSGMIKKRR